MKTAMLPIYDYEKERELLFWPLVQQHQDVIYRVLRKYKFISTSEYDDYTQEIIIEAWKKFYRYMVKRDRVTFGQWLYVEGRSTCYTYRCRQLKIGSHDLRRAYKERYVYKENMEDVSTYESEPYDESHVVVLNKMLQTLNSEELRVVTLFAKGADMQELSVSEGKPIYYYSSRFQSVRKKLQRLAGHYFPDRRIVKKAQSQKSRGYNEHNVRSKEVTQMDFDGKIIKKWPSVNEAERSGLYHAKNIVAAALGIRGSHAGYIWFYQDASPDVIKKRLERVAKSGGKKSMSIPIDQLAYNGTFIKRFPSLLATQQSGFNPQNISAVIKGRAKTHAGFLWKYAQD